ncbi:NAD(P)-dependent oxidoreductase [Piscinibacter gummiphilus]|uniref:NAD(P)-dependent oxidoreductase n=1 Tax=Piscinibacter gummiphilus TaxID=946333 RepID=A0ABZ0CWW4_9BURK|nr:NAD(P)-dependent oxidoreductase [Piscinibacter gummiphilus]WOB07500.1 NAD(P)-dependent oxidoreductase [Piscinibacter gummiphilus]
MAHAESLLLVTGAAGKVGQAFIARLLADPAFTHFRVRALCHKRTLPPKPRLEVVKGAMQERADVNRAMEDVTHVLHLATSKETPDEVMDVAVKGMFWLLEAARTSASLKQFVLVGGDAAIGHFFYPRSAPVTEEVAHSAYPGCYALSKVLEEVMLEQYQIQYGLNGCCLRAPWIMEKDDFKYQLSFGDDVFGGPRWCELVGDADALRYRETGAVPVMLDAEGRPVKRNFVHVDDLVSALLLALDNPRAHQQLMHVCMDEPVDYGELGDYLARTRGLPLVPIRTPYHSTWLDNRKARLLLEWRPRYDLARMVEAAWSFERSPDDPRVVWYPG